MGTIGLTRKLIVESGFFISFLINLVRSQLKDRKYSNVVSFKYNNRAKFNFLMKHSVTTIQTLFEGCLNNQNNCQLSGGITLLIDRHIDISMYTD